ncbi:MAG: Dyp-type peroxidase [Acidobacteria bacterium]|nr:Dyp-type peroxidase [Acidobacteriota bacterium]
MPFNLNQTRISRTDDILSLIQGNILSPYGRVYTRQIFFLLDEGQEGRRMLADLASFVTSAEKQQDLRRDAEKQQRLRRDASETSEPSNDVFANLLLSAAGYERLGLASLANSLSALDFAAAKDALTISDRDLFAQGLYRDGMTGQPSLRAFHDKVSDWQDKLQNRWHGLLWLTSDDPKTLVIAEGQAVARVGEANCHVEPGKLLFNAAGRTKEHFGYADGISQPLFFSDSIEAFTKWDPSAPLSLALLPDPGVPPGEGYGSFLVFRKLEQDVPQFEDMVSTIAKTIDAQSPQTHQERAGAMLVGRHKDGTPLVLDPAPQGTAANDFSNRDEDLEFTRCPGFSHVRRVNPRSDLILMKSFVRDSRIIRRGVPYGEQGGHPVGLLFAAFMSSIVGQFATLQRLWANSLELIRDQPGLDPVIGQVAPGTVIPALQFPKAWNGPKGDTVSVSLSQAVKMRGGEYFFAPSIPFLRRLGQTTSTGD